MTREELDNLMMRIQARGGPVTALGNGYEIMDEKNHFGVFNDDIPDLLDDSRQGWIIEVFERDLDKRGVEHRLEQDNAQTIWVATLKGTDDGEDALRLRTQGASRLEALLKGWALLAEAEWWNP